MTMKKYLMLFMLIIPVIAACDVNNFCEQTLDANLTLFLQNRSNYAPIIGANCSIDVWDVNRTKITDDGNLTEDTEGWYYYTLSSSEVSDLGVYYTLYNCSYGSYVSYTSSDYEIVVKRPSTILYEIWGYITNSTSTMYSNMLNYLQGQLETTLDSSTLIQIAQNTWNETIVEDREITADPKCKNRPWYNAITGVWETEC